MFLRLLNIIILISAIAFPAVWPHAVLAQGFMVEPMRKDLLVAPGNAEEFTLRIRNTAADGPRRVTLRLAELSQMVSGDWSFKETDDPQAGIMHQSALSWIELSARDVEIAPLEPAEVTVRIQPPRGARGTYFAALLVETPPPAAATGISVSIRFLIPLIIEIQGRPARQNVVLDEVAMAVINAEGRDPTTMGSLSVRNAGATFSEVSGAFQVERRNGDIWRLVTRFDTRLRPIMPGSTIVFDQDLERRLPSGEYRLRADILVDGRKLPPLTREIVFEGDPGVDAVAYDTELRLTPTMVRMDVVPGATRTTVLSIENPGTDPVEVKIGGSTPRSLIGVRMGEVVGIDLSAEQWTEVRPSAFTLRGGARQNVRVLSKLPAEAGEHANYYANLTFRGTYPDGQSAGEQTSTIHLFNDRLEPARSGVVEQITLAETEGTGYVVQAAFINTGNIHLEPLARALLVTPQGGAVRDVRLSSDENMLLPLGKRTFGGEMDFDGVAPGLYALRINVELASGENVMRQQVIEVGFETIGGEQVARVMVLEDQELPRPETED